MSSTKIALILFVFSISISSFSQQARTATFGEPTHQELTMTSYEKDIDASAVVLFEKGNNYFKLLSNRIYIFKEVYRKIKVLDAKKFNQATVNIYLLKTKTSKERVTKLKAVTHNGDLQTYIKSDAYYDIDETENWTAKRFTFPNVKDGSILEYSYTIITPYFFNFGGWNYQGELPKIYSEFNSEIPGNFVYNRVIYGKRKLLINEASVKRSCFSLPNFTKTADCEIARYAMKDIPAFKEENYMLSKRNYISRVDYELRSFYDFDGINNIYSKSWKDVDKEFKHDKGTGRQLNYSNYFKNKIPENILSISNELEKAKAVYTFIQKHYSWNGSSGYYTNANVKKAFENKTGSRPEINLSLINALQAADLDAKLVLHSTRDNGLAALSYPVISDFNYVLSFITINEIDYLLDATDPFTPFGIVPFRALNIRGRVMDFKKGSYWHIIVPNKKNIKYISAQLVLNEDEILSGSVSEIQTGYNGINKRKEINKGNKSNYIKNKERIFSDIEFDGYQIENINILDKPLKENYTINYSPEIIGSNLYIYPYFLQNYLSENPFKSIERQFPVDLGYPRTFKYLLLIDLQNRYEVEQLPKNKVIELAGGEGSCKMFYSYSNGKINLRFDFNLINPHFKTVDYLNLREFYSKVVDILAKEAIVLKRI